ncbi:hypothetical protein CSUI_003957, partial [Cystoisospora suis]
FVNQQSQTLSGRSLAGGPREPAGPDVAKQRRSSRETATAAGPLCSTAQPAVLGVRCDTICVVGVTGPSLLNQSGKSVFLNSQKRTALGTRVSLLSVPGWQSFSLPPLEAAEPPLSWHCRPSCSKVGTPEIVVRMWFRAIFACLLTECT